MLAGISCHNSGLDANGSVDYIIGRGCADRPWILRHRRGRVKILLPRNGKGRAESLHYGLDTRHFGYKRATAG